MLFAAFPIVYSEKRGWSEGMSGLAFVGVLIGIIFSAAAVFPNFFWYKKKTIQAGGRLAPEMRLPASFFGAVCLPAGIFWFAWTNDPSKHWAISIAAGVPLGFGMVMVFLPVLNYLIDAYTIFAASVLAANASLRSLFGAAFPLFTTPMFDNLGIHWGSSVPGFLALACVPLPFFFFFYGPAIRRKCTYSAKSEAVMEKLYGKARMPRKVSLDAPSDQISLRPV